jgi:DNA topoisomerase-2
VAIGKYHIVGDSIKVTELPVGVWTQNYKEFIENCIMEHSDLGSATKKSDKDSTVDGGKEKRVKRKYNVPIISYDNHCSEDKVNFTIKTEKGFLAGLGKEEVLKRFKLTKAISTSSMYLYNDHGGIQHYRTPEEIMEEFYGVRMAMYDSRKAYLLRKLMRECIILENKVKFVESVLEDKIKWNLSEEDIERILSNLGINRLDVDDFNLGIDFTTREPLVGGKVSYNYLLEMKIRSLTKEKVEALRREYETKRVEYSILEKKRVTEMWLEDLEAVKKVFVFKTSSPVVVPDSKPVMEVKTIDTPKKKLLVKKPTVVTIAETVEAIEAPKKKLLVKKKPVTMDSFLGKE